MSDAFVCFLFAISPFLNLGNKPPVVVFVPNSLEIGEADSSYLLDHGGFCSDTLGYRYDIVGCLEDMKPPVKPGDQPRWAIVHLLVNQNTFTKADILETVSRLRTGWKTDKRVIVIFRFARIETCSIP